MDEISYHTSRALAELDLARESHDVHAGRRHLELAKEHLARMHELCRRPAAPYSRRPSAV